MIKEFLARESNHDRSFTNLSRLAAYPHRFSVFCEKDGVTGSLVHSRDEDHF